MNLHRRDLTSSQKATVAVDVEKLLADEAKERQRAAGASNGGDKKSAAAKSAKADRQVEKFHKPIPIQLPRPATKPRRSSAPTRGT